MTEELSRRPAPLRGAAARERRTLIFALTLVGGVLLFGFRVALESSTTPELSVELSGRGFTVRTLFLSWAAAAYSVVLATRAIWLPDERLKTASRHLWLMGGGVALVVFVRGVICAVTHR